MGNYNDALMQEIAQNGNGNAYYIDNLNEARKVLVEDLSSTLMTIAKDVKIQVEFNPTLVSEYRLIGYETRALKREDFNNDKVDAGEIGAGHSVTALYEITLVGSDSGSIDTLRYAADKKSGQSNKQVNPNKNELAFLRLRYKAPKESQSRLIEVVINNDEIKQASQMSDNYNFSAAVAGFAQQLRGSKQLSSMDFDTVIALAQKSKGEDKQGYRSEFINMVKLAQVLAQ
jgi:Ca-activated chloride channel family protein